MEGEQGLVDPPAAPFGGAEHPPASFVLVQGGVGDAPASDQCVRRLPTQGEVDAAE